MKRGIIQSKFYEKLIRWSRSCTQQKGLITSFLDLINVYSPGAETDNPQGTKSGCQKKHLVTSVICYKFQKISLKSDLYTFFNDFIHVYSPRTGADNPLGTKFWCQQKGLITLPICCKFQKISLKTDFILFFHAFIHVYSPRVGADNPLGTNFWCQQKGFITLPICCKFKKNLFDVWFYIYFFMLLYVYIVPGKGHITPWGQNFYININLLSLWSFVVSIFHDFLTFFLKKCIFIRIKT